MREEISEGRVLSADKLCPDYKIKEKSTACENCRFNHFKLESGAQVCKPHSHEEAIKKGAPSEAPKGHFTHWLNIELPMRQARREEEERVLLKRLGPVEEV